MRGTDGRSVLNADPAIICDVSVDETYVYVHSNAGHYMHTYHTCIACGTRSVDFGRWLRKWALVTLPLYGIGIPSLFIGVLVYYRKEIAEDQLLRKQGLGYTAASNPHFSMRRRFQKLYSDFKPNRYGWRMFQLARKFLLVATTVLFTNLPLFQVRPHVVLPLLCSQNVVVSVLSLLSLLSLLCLLSVVCCLLCSQNTVRARRTS